MREQVQWKGEDRVREVKEKVSCKEMHAVRSLIVKVKREIEW